MATDHRYEVELKFRVQDLDAVLVKLQELGADVGQIVDQADSYFGHPSRNFAETDEAFRVRRMGHLNYMTYKGPKLDTTTKTRREIELPLPEGQRYAEQFAELLAALGFTPVAVVNKRRRIARLDWQDHEVEIALDDVAQVGLFVELELQADESTRARAQEVVLALARELQLDRGERRSYLQMLLDNSN